MGRLVRKNDLLQRKGNILYYNAKKNLTTLLDLMYNSAIVRYDVCNKVSEEWGKMAKLKTGRHTSALKEARKAKKRTVRNTATKSKIRTAIKRVETAVKNNDVKVALEQLAVAFSQWDKAAKKNVVHFKAASNQKARLSKLVAGIKK